MMIKKVFFDTNILLDAILNRENSSNALLLIDLCRVGKIQGFVAPLSYANIAYILRKRDKEEVHSTLRKISKHIKTLPMDEIQFENAISYGPVEDFEDMLQYQCALLGECKTIITNNTKDFMPFSSLPVMTAGEFLIKLLDTTSK